MAVLTHKSGFRIIQFDSRDPFGCSPGIILHVEQEPRVEAEQLDAVGMPGARNCHAGRMESIQGSPGGKALMV